MVVLREHLCPPRARTQTASLLLEMSYAATMLPFDSIATLPAEDAAPILNGTSSGCGSPLTPPAGAADAAVSAVPNDNKLTVLTAMANRRMRDMALLGCGESSSRRVR